MQLTLWRLQRKRLQQQACCSSTSVDPCCIPSRVIFYMVMGTLSRISFTHLCWTHWGWDKMDAILQTTFSIKISLKFVPKGQIDNIPAMAQVMPWCRPSDKPLSEPMVVGLLMHICITRPQWVKGILSRMSFTHLCFNGAYHPAAILISNSHSNSKWFIQWQWKYISCIYRMSRQWTLSGSSPGT